MDGYNNQKYVLIRNNYTFWTQFVYCGALVCSDLFSVHWKPDYLWDRKEVIVQRLLRSVAKCHFFFY